MPTENRSSNTEMTLTFTESSLSASLDKVQSLHDLGCELIAEAVFQQPAPHPHAEPIAWMVGTAFWWTKEEAERDAAATGLPVTPIGPLLDLGRPADQRKADVAGGQQV
ncbi:hypothetical protein ACIPZF_22275 [Pseudomonas sp. NPDC089752]|uniref:hypothetical protein n=1 Tax=Pseudomonas sp. NPDC089752 TaxID=3364472 RepID=UPI003820AF91